MIFWKPVGLLQSMMGTATQEYLLKKSLTQMTSLTLVKLFCFCLGSLVQGIELLRFLDLITFGSQPQTILLQQLYLATCSELNSSANDITYNCC